MPDLQMECIPTTDVPWDFVIRSLDECASERWAELRRTKDLVNYVARPARGGHFSNVQALEFYFEGEPEPFRGFLKTFKPFIEMEVGEGGVENLPPPPPPPKDRPNMLEEIKNHFIQSNNSEILFYQLYKPYFKDYVLPNLAGFRRGGGETAEPGWIVLEDIGREGGMASIRRGMTIQQTLHTVRALAHLHAHSLTRPGAAEALRQMAAANPVRAQPKMPVNELLFHCGDYFRKHEKLLRHIHHTRAGRPDHEYRKFGIRPVLSHGDLWNNNVFFRRGADGEPGDQLHAIIDYQMAGPGTGVDDLARLIASSCGADAQRFFTLRFLQVYHETLARRLRDAGDRLDYDFETLKEMYWYHYPQEALFALFILSHEYLTCAEPALQKSIQERMIALFEPIRERYEHIVQ